MFAESNPTRTRKSPIKEGPTSFMSNVPKLSRFVRGTLRFDSIHEITIHEPSSFLKRGHKLQSIPTICVDSIELPRIDNIFNPPSRSRSTIFSKSRANRLPACRIDKRGNDSCRCDGIGFTNCFPVCRIANTKDESTLVGCIGQPLIYRFRSP